jgi:4-hydroxy-tetrahydrodipicolinate synthase
MKNNFPTGTGVALVTPFLSTLEVDYNALANIIDFNIQHGVDYFVVLGTTGESVTLSEKEKDSIYHFVTKHVNKRVPLVAGIGGNNTFDVVEHVKHFNVDGYHAILSVAPYYNKPSQEGIFQHYMKVAENASLPIILYNVPGRTSSNITAETCIRLARASDKFIAVKEASGNFTQIMQIIKHKPSHFTVISGDDNLTLPMMSLGAKGVISVVAQALPKSYSSMVTALLNNDYALAQSLHYQMLDAMEYLFAEGNPAGIKAALHAKALCENILRLPLVPVSVGLYDKIKKSLL